MSAYHLTVPFFMSSAMFNLVEENAGRETPGAKAATALRSARRRVMTFNMVVVLVFIL